MQYRLNKSIKLLQRNDRIYQLDVPVIGLTGGIASGKTLACSILSGYKIPIISADKLVKNIYQTPAAFKFIKRNFPQALSGNEKIVFSILRELAFTKGIKTTLEDFLYPQMARAFQTQFNKIKSPNLIIYDIPLLFEKNMSSLFDLTVCIYAPGYVQLERLMKRDNINRQLAKAMIHSQMTIDRKKKLANYSIDNTSNQEDLRKKVDSWCQNIFIGKGG